MSATDVDARQAVIRRMLEARQRHIDAKAEAIHRGDATAASDEHRAIDYLDTAIRGEMTDPKPKGLG